MRRRISSSRYTVRQAAQSLFFLEFSLLCCTPTVRQWDSSRLSEAPPPRPGLQRGVGQAGPAGRRIAAQTAAPPLLIHISAVTGPRLSCKTPREGEKKKKKKKSNFYDALCYHKRENEGSSEFSQWDVNELIRRESFCRDSSALRSTCRL